MFQLLIRFVTIALVVFSASTHSAELEAPVGLQWGQTQRQIESKGVSFYDCAKMNGESTHCFTENPPKPLSFASFYGLNFYPGLHKVGVVGKDITRDLYGTEGKKQFADLKQRLSAKYGKPNPNYTIERVGLKLYRKSDEFYQCLAYAGCGAWQTGWKIDDAAIGLEIVGTARGKGYIRLTYESKDFGRLLDEAKAQQAAADDAGL